MELLTAQHIEFSINGRFILKDISFSLHSGRVIVLLGKNGSGKSLLLKIIAGLVRDFKGDVFLGDISVNSIKGVYPAGIKPLLAYVFQKGGLFDSMSVYENVAFGLHRIGFNESEISLRVMDSLEKVGLKGNEAKFPSELSGGMQKRVGIARAISMEPDVILFDDPTAGLDPILSDSIADLILDVTRNSGRSAIVVTNDADVALKLADEVALLFDGNFVFFGDKEEFFYGNNEYALQFINGLENGPIDLF
ncbi:MAG TPA: ATP-binding cassette domain-containing protein [Spirochaetota bacterium]|nr:ATP-binding cassette domain-containing protein [Spirochaetota bacterium]